MGFRVQVSGFRVQGLGFEVWGLGFRVQDFRNLPKCTQMHAVFFVLETLLIMVPANTLVTLQGK